MCCSVFAHLQVINHDWHVFVRSWHESFHTRSAHLLLILVLLCQPKKTGSAKFRIDQPGMLHRQQHKSKPVLSTAPRMASQQALRHSVQSLLFALHWGASSEAHSAAPLHGLACIANFVLSPSADIIKGTRTPRSPASAAFANFDVTRTATPDFCGKTKHDMGCLH